MRPAGRSSTSGTLSLSPGLQSLLLVGLFVPLVSARKITVTNSCSGTVWPAYKGDSSGVVTVNGKKGTGGWMQASGQSDVLEVPEDCEYHPHA
jgi:hypothetical protein